MNQVHDSFLLEYRYHNHDNLIYIGDLVLQFHQSQGE